MSPALRTILPAVFWAPLLALAPSAAQAGGSMQTGIADDRLLLANDASVAPLAQTWARLGVDSVRIHARWIAIAPRPDDRKQPAGFDGSDPTDPGYNFGALDTAVRELRANGIEPILAVTGSGPVWSSRNPALDNPRYKPDPALFGEFAGAVAKRYAATVNRYLIWNEPNQPGWLQPQFSCARGRCTAQAPHLYRDLFRTASSAIRRSDPGAKVIFGTLAPRGSSPTARNAKTRPLAFLRAMGCVTASYRRDRTGACRTAKAVRADGFAYHPHPILMAPDQSSAQRDDASIADLGRLSTALDKVTAAGIVKPVRGARFDIHLTEFGYQTNPPDPNIGVSVTRQASWVQHGAYLAWTNPRVKTITQYEYQDEPIKTNSDGTDPFASWQSGMLFFNGRPKPLLAAFPNPFWIDVRRGRTTARFWGQVRVGGANTVNLQRRSGRAWKTLKAIGTSSRGYWTADLPVRSAGEYRFTYPLPLADGSGTETRVSLPQRVAPLG